MSTAVHVPAAVSAHRAEDVGWPSERLEERQDGTLALRLKTRWRDGTTHVLMERRELIERLGELNSA